MRLLPVLLLVLSTGCASTLSTMQTARPLAKGQLQFNAGYGLYLPVGQIVDVVDTAIDLGAEAKDAVEEDRPYELSEQAQQELLTAGAALAVAPPGFNPEFMVRVGVLDEVDVGLRYSGISLRGDFKVRLAHGGDAPASGWVPRGQRSFDVALGAAISRHFFDSPVLDVLEVVEMGEFSRYDIEIPLYLSADWSDIFKLYGTPKYVYSHTKFDAKLVNFASQGKPVTGFDASLPGSVSSHFVGSTVGIGVGYKYVHLFAEVTGGYLFCKPQLFGTTRNLGGVTLYPALGLAVRTGGPEAKARGGQGQVDL
ncbi:MAG TPA: hypothetical protein VE153_21780 [Myxococcus sp.]|nr:hypothetical protein [Myxococcus sp.]